MDRITTSGAHSLHRGDLVRIKGAPGLLARVTAAGETTFETERVSWLRWSWLRLCWRVRRGWAKVRDLLGIETTVDHTM